MYYRLMNMLSYILFIVIVAIDTALGLVITIIYPLLYLFFDLKYEKSVYRMTTLYLHAMDNYLNDLKHGIR